VLQRHLGMAHVVKVCNNITFWHLASLARAAGAADRCALPIAGDDPAAKAAVTEFLDAIGYDTVDAGTLGAGGRRFQFGTRAFVTPYGTFSDQRGTPGRQGGNTRRHRRLTATGDWRLEIRTRADMAPGSCRWWCRCPGTR